MRVLLLVESLAIGGLPNYVLELARALSAHGHRVAVAHGGGAVPEHLHTEGVELLALTAGGFDQPYQLAAVMETLAQWQPELLHLHLCSVLPLLEALPSLGIPVLRSFHDYTSLCLRRGRRRFPGDRCARALGWSCALQGCLLGAPKVARRQVGLQNLPGKLAERAAYQAFGAALVGSQHMRRVLLLNGFAPERVRVLPYFSRFDQQALAGPLLSVVKAPGVAGQERPLRLLFTGQAVKGKGLEVLIKALVKLDCDWQLTAISSGPRLALCKALAARYGIESRIEFIEWLAQDALADYYQHADLLVLPSVWDDPGPLVGIEAMSFATPVLAFAVGGIGDYVLDGQTGYLADTVSVAGLTAALQRACARAWELPGLGRAARELVAQRHTRLAHVQQLQGVYGGLLERQQNESMPLVMPA